MPVTYATICSRQYAPSSSTSAFITAAYVPLVPVLHPEAQKKNEERLLATRRFSRSFVGHLRELRDFPLGLSAVFGVDRDGAPLLAASVVEGVKARLDKVVAHVEATRTAADSVDVEPFE